MNACRRNRPGPPAPAKGVKKVKGIKTLMPRWMTLFWKAIILPDLEILDRLDRLDRLTTPVEKTAARDDSLEVGATARQSTDFLGPAAPPARPLAPAAPEPLLSVACDPGSRFHAWNGTVSMTKAIKNLKAGKMIALS